MARHDNEPTRELNRAAIEARKSARQARWWTLVTFVLLVATVTVILVGVTWMTWQLALLTGWL